MDELNELKKMWDSSFEEQNSGMDQKTLLKIMQSKSSGPVDKLKKSLYLEIGTILLVLPFLVYIMFVLPQSYFVLNTLALIILFVIVLVYYFVNLRKITRLWNQSQQNLRQSLESTLLLLRFFRKTYYYINIALFPLGIYFGYIIGFGLGSGGKKVSSLLFFQTLPLYLNILLYIAIAAAAFGLFLLFLHFYVKKLYDVHIKKLEINYAELTENENAQTT
ncbi:MAG: hypothetical protein EA361_03490 [Bacteroidetes bacterium]|nr:MAG: hypothetical protein EA361_03490 [Bacteroidota bacterium]